MDGTGHFHFLQEQKARVLKRNPHLAQLITGEKAPTKAHPAKLVVKPIFPRGRYIPRTIDDLIILVARHSDQHPLAISGNGRTRRLVDARFCIGVLAKDFAPRQSPAAIDDALLRGSGMTIWYRSRHEDRIRLYPEYGVLYERCLLALTATPCS